MDVYVGSDVEVVTKADVLTMSPAVSLDDVEITAARDAVIPVMSRAEFLARLTHDHEVVAFAGTHGKTTATSMYLMVAQAAKQHPSWLLGAPVAGFGDNGGYGSHQLVLELDESYGTFADVAPSSLGLLNVEADHLDHYGDLAGVQQAFRELVSRTKRHVIVWYGSTAHDLVKTVNSIVTVGDDPRATWRVGGVSLKKAGSSFTLESDDVTLTIALKVPGFHNVVNSAIVAVTALMNAVPASAVVEGLSRFVGAPRRYEIHGTMTGSDALVIEDYAHLPSEIRTAITTARGGTDRKVIAVFQPHRVTRTTNLTQEFGAAFDGLDELFVTDIFTSGEPNPEGVTGQIIVDAVLDQSSTPVRYIADRREAATYLQAQRGDADVVLVLGAGDIGELATWLTGEFDER
jgi:UDP-N-acetylmuramate--alanine ligase